ncbi:MAG: VOC family protein [Candidatus Coatesbacteria bacterium]|nr:VOC family protein [Candidatus Coatesbacteria bacterium]
MSLIKDFNGIAFYVTDLGKAREFYVNMLGFEVTYEMDYGIFIKCGEITGYIEGGRKPFDIEPLTYPTICPVFKVESVKKAFQELKDKSANFVEEYRNFSDDFAMFSIADPDGNVIEFAGQP